MAEGVVDIRTQPSESLAMQQRYKPQPPPSESGSDESFSSSESETEDEDGEQLTAHIDAAIFRTLQKIRSKDASLYDPSVDVFSQEEKAAMEAASKRGMTVAQVKEKKDKKVTLQDYQRQRVEELMKSSNDPARDLADATMAPQMTYDDERSGELLAPAQEQELLRKQISQAFHDCVDDDDDLFTKRSDKAPQAGTYRDNILAALGEDADEETIRKALRSSEQKKEEAAEEKKNEDFLLDFILNQRWIDKDAPAPAALTSSALKKKDEVEKGYGRDWDAEAADLASEASFDSKADAFEATYNFRFEQGEGANTIPSFARNPKDSVRREDDSRKRKREERAARKEEEKQKKMQELARIKNLKRAEIVEKLKKLREATGSSHVEGLDEIDLEKEFDPEEHDRAMQGVFNNNYYGQEDDVDDNGKPVWNDELEIDDILAQEEKPSKKQKKKAKAAEDDDKIEMDADFMEEGEAPAGAASGVDKIRAQLQSTKLSKKDRKKLKKKLKAAEEKLASKPADEIYMDADEETTEPKTSAREMLDEYYNLDYEDVVGDQPTRFKYTQVAPSNFGMTPVEILLADDAQLNNVVGMKSLQPYKRGKTRPADLGKRLHDFRQEMSGRKSGGEQRKPSAAGAGTGEGEKRLGKKQRERERKRKLEAEAAEAAKANEQ